jgi:hypothetical protein
MTRPEWLNEQYDLLSLPAWLREPDKVWSPETLMMFLLFSSLHNYFDATVQVLFCSTENGRTSFVRQLEPDWHIDTNPEIIFQLSVYSCYLSCYFFKLLYSDVYAHFHGCHLNYLFIYWLQRFIKYQLHISPTRSERAASNVFNSPSLEQFFGCV